MTVIAGYEAEPGEADLAAAEEIEDIAAAWPGDPLPRYAALTSRQAHYTAVAGRLADARAAVIAQMRKDGMSYGQIAAVTGLTRARVQQLAGKGHAIAVTGELDLLVRP